MSLSNIKPFVRKPYRKASSGDQIPLQSYVQVDEAQSEYDVFRSRRASTVRGPQQQHIDEGPSQTISVPHAYIDRVPRSECRPDRLDLHNQRTMVAAVVASGTFSSLHWSPSI